MRIVTELGDTVSNSTRAIIFKKRIFCPRKDNGFPDNTVKTTLRKGVQKNKTTIKGVFPPSALTIKMTKELMFYSHFFSLFSPPGLI